MRIKISVLGLICVFLISCVAIQSAVQLPKQRQNYVESNTWISPEIKEAILNGRVILGMTIKQVLASRGRPLDINRTTRESGTHEQWVYVGVEINTRMRMSRKETLLDHEFGYIYFENGIVTSWQSR
ncbi:hypothetical protein ES703_123307 [subsurface metagenome]